MGRVKNLWVACIDKAVEDYTGGVTTFKEFKARLREIGAEHILDAVEGPDPTREEMEDVAEYDKEGAPF